MQTLYLGPFHKLIILYVINSKLDSYADFKFCRQIVYLIQQDLDTYEPLVLNAKKSSVMFTCSHQKMLTLNTENICLTYLNNQVLNVQKEQKVLGVTIDSILSSRCHIINMCKIFSHLLCLLGPVRF